MHGPVKPKQTIPKINSKTVPKVLLINPGGQNVVLGTPEIRGIKEEDQAHEEENEAPRNTFRHLKKTTRRREAGPKKRTSPESENQAPKKRTRP